MATADIVITEFMDEAAVADLAGDHDVLYDPTLHKREGALVAAAASARAIIVRNQTQVRGALLEGLGALRVVGRLGVGLDNIDADACRQRGIEVFPATGANDIAVAEYVIAGLLMLLRGSYFSTATVAAGTWPRTALIGREASGRTLGLVGFGGIARQVARRAAALGLKMVGCDPMVARDDRAWAEHWVKPVDLDRLLDQSDAISLHVPLTATTKGLFGARSIGAMKPGSVLINTARGGVVDESALAAALRDGRLAGAMLDVFEHEPLSAANPFAGVPNLMTPHIAGVTEESNVRVSAVTAENVRRALERLP